MVGLLVVVFNRIDYCWRGLNKITDAISSAPQGAYKAQFHQTISFLTTCFA
jgi:hypothetical protein